MASTVWRGLRRIFGSTNLDAPVVNVLRLRGVIGGGTGGSLALHKLDKALIQAFDKKPHHGKLEAVAVSVNSPGGSPVQSALIAGRIKALAGQNELPVFTFAEDVAASGGYWLLSAGDEAFAHPSSIVGSIGVITGSFGAVDTLKKLGLERRILTAGDNKMRSDPFSPLKPEDVAFTRRLLSQLHAQFKDAMLTNRQGKLDEARLAEVFSGDVWLGDEAVRLGLVDGVGDMHSVLRDKYGPEVRLLDVPLAQGFARWFASTAHGIDGAPSSALSVHRDGQGGLRVDGLSVEAALAALEERAVWAPYRTW